MLCVRGRLTAVGGQRRKVKGLHSAATVTATASCSDHPRFLPGFGMFLRKWYPGSPPGSDLFPDNRWADAFRDKDLRHSL